MPSVPVAHAVGMKETYEPMEVILKVINYSEHNWNFCGDLKVISLLLGLQLGYTKHMCFLCLWNSCDDSNHYKMKQWPPQDKYTVGRYNVQHKSPVDPLNIYFPPLHIKLGFMKNFVVAMDSNGKAFHYLEEKFKAMKTDAKLQREFLLDPKSKN